MTRKLIIGALLGGFLACSNAAPIYGKTLISDHVNLYRGSKKIPVVNNDHCRALIAEAIHLFEQADDIYLKPISPTDIEAFHQSGCLEIVFSPPRLLRTPPLKEPRQIAKLLIPTAPSMIAKPAQILFGAPDYRPFNRVLNTAGLESLLKLISRVAQ